MATDSTKIKRLILIASLLKSEQGLGVDSLVKKLKTARYTCCGRTIRRDISCLKKEFNAKIRYSRRTYSYVLDEEPDWDIKDARSYSDTTGYEEDHTLCDFEARESSTPYYAEVALKKVTIECDKELWNSISSNTQHELENISDTNCGKLIITFATISEKDLYYIILKYPDQVKVKDPQKVKDAVEHNAGLITDFNSI